MQIGKKIKELREERKMSLTDLSQKSEIQLATLSRIEHLKMVGTLDSHLKIAKALGVPLSELYGDIMKGKNKVEVQTTLSASNVFIHDNKSSYELLTSKVLSKKMMPILLKIEPGGETQPEQNRFDRDKFIFILDGKIEARITGDTYTLSKDNMLYFNGSLEHKFVNVGKQTARVLCVTSPVEF